ncbi:hypothetical protein HW555_011719 [Spodoptera exigua]|uniref:Uncharacterized protein n=1 Tax=Spodoptera exigua TaxID=7107 RepID=A0A835G6K2_SPOEX|nr:hypothetical protein HW555_011719 [Spodoptera exigua]
MVLPRVLNITQPVRSRHVAAMRSGALVTLVASSLYLTLRYPSSMELLIPLLASAAASGEPYERARSDHDAPFSNIPDSAFTLDEGILDADSASHPTAAPQRVHKKVLNSHEEGVDYYRPRSIYVSSMEQRAERPADAWRCCGTCRRRPGQCLCPLSARSPIVATVCHSCCRRRPHLLPPPPWAGDIPD